MKGFKVYSKLKLAIEKKGNGILLSRDKEYDEKIVQEYCVVDSYKDVKAILNSQKPVHFYEIFLVDKVCNFIQDLDITDPEGRADPVARVNNIVEITTASLIEYAKIQDINLERQQIQVIKMKSPPTEKKDSFHLVYRIQGFYFRNLYEGCKNFHQFMVKTKKELLLGVDDIYTKNRSFRILNSSKMKFPDNKLELFEQVVSDPLSTMGTYVISTESDHIFETLVIKTSVKAKQKTEHQELESQEDIDVVSDLLECLSADKATTFESWNNLGILLYCIFNGNQKGKEHWKRFCLNKNSEAYDEEQINEFWDNYSNLESRKYSIGTLYYWAKIDNPELYTQKLSSMYETDCLLGSHRQVAELFFNRFNHTFVKTEDFWLKFDETAGIWRPESKCKKGINEAFDIIVKEIKMSKEKGEGLSDESKYKNILKSDLCHKLQNVQFKSCVMTELNWRMFIKNTNTDNNKWLFPFDNGVFDLKTKTFRKGLYEEYITQTCGYNYQYASSKMAADFMTDVFPNEGIRKYFLTVVASHLADVHLREEFFCLYNRAGNNGKTTMLNAMGVVFGLFYYSCKSQILTESKYEGTGEEASPVLMNMKNKRFISYQETKNGVKLDSETIKRLTGGDTINARKLHSDSENFRINGIHIQSTNDIPTLGNIDGGIIRRFRCIAMETEFVLEPKAPHERAVKDIDVNSMKFSMFQLLVEHLNEVPKGIDYCPLEIQRTTNSYLNNSDNILRFIEQQLQQDPEGCLTKSDIKWLFVDKDISREYELYKLKFSDFCERIESKLKCRFEERATVGGVRRRGALYGYSLKAEDTDNHMFD